MSLGSVPLAWGWEVPSSPMLGGHLEFCRGSSVVGGASSGSSVQKILAPPDAPHTVRAKCQYLFFAKVFLGQVSRRDAVEVTGVQ